MEDSFLCAVEEKAVAFFRSRIQGSSLLLDGSAIADFSGLRDGSFSGLEADMGDFRGKYFAEVHSRVIFSHCLVGREIKKFSTEEAGRFRESFLAAIAAKIKKYLELWSVEISGALYREPYVLPIVLRLPLLVLPLPFPTLILIPLVPVPVLLLLFELLIYLRARLAAAACPSIDPVVAHARDAARACAADDCARAAEAHAAVASCFVAQARAADSSAPNFGSNSNLVLDSLFATALTNHAASRVADARTATVALAHVRRAAAPTSNTDPDSARARILALDRVRAALPIPGNDSDPVRARSCVVRADSRARAAVARAAADDADRAVAQARVVVADRVVAQSSAADSCAPDIDSNLNLIVSSIAAVTTTTDSNSACTATVAIAGSSTSLLTPGSSSLVLPGFVDLFGFLVPSELSEVVRKLISDVCVLSKNFYPGTLRVPVSDVFHEHSDSEERRCDWCLTNMKLYEFKFVAK